MLNRISTHEVDSYIIRFKIKLYNINGTFN